MRVAAGCRFRADLAEMLDNGVRLATMMGRELLSIADAPVTKVAEMDFDGLGAQPEPEIDEALVGRVAAQMSEWRDEAFRQLRHLDCNAPRRIHIEALKVVVSIDDFLEAVAEHLREQS